MRRSLHLALLLLAGAAGPAAAGPWSSYAHPYTYTSVLVQGDTVWCGTLEAGLLQYRPANPTPDHFLAWRREPGGISSNRVTALAMERTRRLWVGTDGGGISLLSADRTRWDLIRTELNSTSINALTPQGDSMWIATTQGIALWDGHSIVGSIPFGETDTSPFGDVDITGIVPLGDSLFVSNSQGVWVSRISTGFQSWSLDTAGFRLPSMQALAITRTSLFALGNTDVYEYDRAAGRWNLIGRAGNIGRVVKITAQDGALIASTAEGDPGVSPGIWLWRVATRQWVNQSDAFANAPVDPKNQFTTALGPDGTIWAADIQGLFHQGTTPYNWSLSAPISPPGNNAINLIVQGSKVYVNALIEASFGGIAGGGVGRFDGTQWRNWPPVLCAAGCDSTFQYPPFPFALLADRRGRKWVACWSGALEEFDDSVSPPQFTHHYVDDPIEDGRDRHSNGWSAIEDAAGGHWIGMDYGGGKSELQAVGIDYYDTSGVFVRNFRPDSVPSMRAPYVRALLAGRKRGGGRVFVGELGGLQYVDLPLPASTEPTFVDVSTGYAPRVQGIAAFGDSLWVLTDSDLRRYSMLDLNVIEVFSIPGNAAETALHPLEVGPDGTLWIGSEKGLRALHPGGRVEDWNAANSPLLDDRVRAIRVDPATGKVWIASGGGINVYDPGYVAPGDTVPARLLVQAYPNPVMITALGVSIRIQGNASHYSVDVIDVRGRRVRHLDGVANAKPFWNARDDSGNLVRPGIYFIRIETGGRTATARVALIR